MQRTFLLTSLLLASASATGLKGASSNPNQSRRALKGLHGPRHRECDIDEKKDEVKFECKTKPESSKDSKSGSSDEPEDRGISITPDASIKDKIKYKIKTTKDDGISVKLEYKNEIEMDDLETETKTKFELLFQELVEYVKSDSTEEGVADSQAYDWDQDEIVQRIPLTEWTDIPGVVDNGVEAYFTVRSEDYLQGGHVAFNFTIARADVGERVTANSMKIDVRILDFPWTRSDSYVALLSTLESEKKVKVEYEKDAQVGKGGKKAKDVSISFGEDMEETFGFNTYGQYTWANDAEATGIAVDAQDFNGTVMMARQGGEPLPENVIMVDNTTSTIEVIATSPVNSTEDENVQQIAYSFVGDAAQGASDIYWDPETGIGYESGVARTGVLMGLAGTAVVAMFSLLA